MSGNSIERLLDKIDAGTSNFLIFAGVLDNNAKLLSFRRGKAKFSLPIERHDTLDVQLSLMFSLIRQLEDISGDHKFTATRFERHDIFLFGTSDFHIFVITSPASEGQLPKTMALLAAIMVESELPISHPALVGRTTHQSGESGMASTIHHNAPNLEIQRPSSSKPEAVSILQGYLMALEPGVTIQDDFSGNFKIKSNESDQFAWSTLEKLGSVFKDKIDFHNIGLDSDGRVFVSFSLKQ